MPKDEFEKIDPAMRELIKVPHMAIKKRLDAENSPGAHICALFADVGLLIINNLLANVSCSYFHKRFLLTFALEYERVISCLAHRRRKLAPTAKLL